MILSRKLASIHYLRTWFSLDILSLLPYDLMANWFIRGDVETYANTFKTVKVWRLSKTLRALRALRLIRLVRVAKMPRMYLHFLNCLPKLFIFCSSSHSNSFVLCYYFCSPTIFLLNI